MKIGSSLLNWLTAAAVFVASAGQFDANFTLMSVWGRLESNGRSIIQCFTDHRNATFSFSRALDTGQGTRLPKHARQNSSSRILSMPAGGKESRYGAFQCEISSEGVSTEIITLKLPPADDADLDFPEPYKVVSVGDSVVLEVNVWKKHELPIKWRRNGLYMRLFDDILTVQLEDVQFSDAGIYEAYYDGRRPLGVHALTRLVVRNCPANVFGKDCDQECPPCYNGGICHDTWGVCVCPVGFAGLNCEIACDVNHFGSDCSKMCAHELSRRNTDEPCAGTLFCKPDPYGCSCARGFKGSNCTEYCEPGWYGADCKQPCHCADGIYACNRITGACKGGCAKGWTGDSCQIEGAEEREESSLQSTVCENLLASSTKLLRDLETLLLSGDGSDLTLLVKGQKFRAHGAILRARSPVLASKLADDRNGNSTMLVDEDSDPEIFLDFLRFLYSGSVRYLTSRNACSLHRAADKYEVQDLKSQCLTFIKSHLEVDNFCDVLILAFRNNETDLVKQATDFFADNMLEIITTVKWRKFLSEYTAQANGLLIQALSDNKENRISEPAWSYSENNTLLYPINITTGRPIFPIDSTGAEMYVKNNITNRFEYPKNKDGREVYRKDQYGNEIPLSENGQSIYAKDKEGRELYPKDKDGAEVYIKDQYGNEIPVSGNGQSRRYAKDGEGREIYPKTADNDEYYLKENNTEIGALYYDELDYVPYYAKKTDGSEFYPKTSNNDEYYFRGQNGDVGALHYVEETQQYVPYYAKKANGGGFYPKRTNGDEFYLG